MTTDCKLGDAPADPAGAKSEIIDGIKIGLIASIILTTAVAVGSYIREGRETRREVNATVKTIITNVNSGKGIENDLGKLEKIEEPRGATLKPAIDVMEKKCGECKGATEKLRQLETKWNHPRKLKLRSRTDHKYGPQAMQNAQPRKIMRA